jgi:hypothetical protein
MPLVLCLDLTEIALSEIPMLSKGFAVSLSARTFPRGVVGIWSGNQARWAFLVMDLTG